MALVPKLESRSVGHYRYYPSVSLGKGNFATVYPARHKVVKCEVALKIINIDAIKEDYVLRNLDREENILRTLHHPNIIRLYEKVTEGNLHCLSLELVHGVNLFEYIKNQLNNNIPEKNARFFFYQMLSAVDYMHNLNVIHRDLKLENILVEYGHIIKIVDFGLSNVYYPCVELRTHCGSIEYAAPELFHSSAYGTPADIWSLGVILYVMVIGKMPFEVNQKNGKIVFNSHLRYNFMHRIAKGLLQDNWEQMEYLSPELWDLLHVMLEPDQFRRIRIKDAITHPWMTRDKYMMKRLPQRRKDLHRKFHPQVIEYLAHKLNTSSRRIEKHLCAYQKDNIAAMYYMVRDILVKEVLQPPKNFKNSFLYQFEMWRENLKSLRTINYRREYLDLRKENVEKNTEESSLVFSKDIPENDNYYKGQSRNFNEQCMGDHEHIGLSTKYYAAKKDQHSLKDVDIESKIVKEQEKSVSRTPYRSYRKSRPENISSSNNTCRETVKSNTNIDKKEKNSLNSMCNKKVDNIDEEEFAKKCQISYHNKLNVKSDIERKVPISVYREYSSKALTTEKNKMQYTTYTKTKSLLDENGRNSRKLYSSKIQDNSVTEKIAILKRTKNNADTQKNIPKSTDEPDIDLESPEKQFKNKKNDDTLKSIYAQTPSKIPVKSLRYGPPAPFSPSTVASPKKITELAALNQTKHCKADIK